VLGSGSPVFRSVRDELSERVELRLERDSPSELDARADQPQVTNSAARARRLLEGEVESSERTSLQYFLRPSMTLFIGVRIS
jgi:hypothetical protein